MGRNKIVKELELFRKSLPKDTPVSKMILFGSRAWGKPHKDSDVDLIVVSSAFRKKKSFRRGINLYTHWKLSYPVDFLCYTPKEFMALRKRKTIVRIAAEKG